MMVLSLVSDPIFATVMFEQRLPSERTSDPIFGNFFTEQALAQVPLDGASSFILRHHPYFESLRRNVAFGTIPQDAGLMHQIESEFDRLGKLFHRPETAVLSEADVDRAYGTDLKIQSEIDALRRDARARAANLTIPQIFFIDPPDGKTLWWMGDGWAAATYSQDRPQIYVSRRLLGRYSRDVLAAIVWHEVLHKNGRTHQQARAEDEAAYREATNSLRTLANREMPSRSYSVHPLDGSTPQTYEQGIPKAKFDSLDGAFVKGGRLDSAGRLKLGGRKSPWASFADLPYAPYEIRVEQGFIVHVGVQQPNGSWLEADMARAVDRSSGKLADAFYHELSTTRFKRLKHVTIFNLTLDERGALKIGGRGFPWATFSEYPGASVEIDVDEGLVTEVRIQKPDGNWQKEPFAGIYDRTSGRKQDVFWKELPEARFSRLSGVTIKDVRLDAQGGLYIGGRRWATFKDLAGKNVEIDVEDGCVTEARIARAEAPVEVKTFSRIYDRRINKLIDTFYGYYGPEELAKLDKVSVTHFRLNDNGRLLIGGHGVPPWATYSSFPNAEVEFWVDLSKVVWVKLVKDKSGRPINSRTGDGFGRVSAKRSLLKLEDEFRKALAEGLKRHGLDGSIAYTVADTLVRLKDGSLKYLEDYGFLSEANRIAIHDIAAGQLKLEELAQAFRAHADIYEELIKLSPDSGEGETTKPAVAPENRDGIRPFNHDALKHFGSAA